MNIFESLSLKEGLETIVYDLCGKRMDTDRDSEIDGDPEHDGMVIRHDAIGRSRSGDICLRMIRGQVRFWANQNPGFLRIVRKNEILIQTNSF